MNDVLENVFTCQFIVRYKYNGMYTDTCEGSKQQTRAYVQLNMCVIELH